MHARRRRLARVTGGGTHPPTAAGDRNTQFMKDEYPDTKSDLFAAFIERCTVLAGPRGTVAMITMQSWMFLSSYEKLRASLLAKQRITSMMHLGARAFDSIGGEVVSSTAFVLANVAPEARGAARKRAGTFIRLVDGTSEAEKVNALSAALEIRAKEAGFYLASDADFTAIPGSPIVYWLSEKMRAVFTTGKRLGAVADIKHGLSTGKNEAVVRLWWEIAANRFMSACSSTREADESGKAWFPYNSGGSFRKWYGNVEKVLRYDKFGRDLMASFPGHRHDGRARYFQKGVTWSKVSSGAPAFRSQPVGQVFDVAGNGFFVDNPAGLNDLLAFCNSSTAQAMLAALSPTLNFEAGQIAKLPVSTARNADVEGTAEQLIGTARLDWDGSETSWDFAINPLIELASNQ